MIAASALLQLCRKFSKKFQHEHLGRSSLPLLRLMLISRIASANSVLIKLIHQRHLAASSMALEGLEMEEIEDTDYWDGRTQVQAARPTSCLQG
jgi:hypothetical protein